MKRPIEQWRSCNPKMMAVHLSSAAVMYALEDAKADILTLHSRCFKAAGIITTVADELKDCSTVGGEWDGTEISAQEEYERLMEVVSELETTG